MKAHDECERCGHTREQHTLAPGLAAGVCFALKWGGDEGTCDCDRFVEAPPDGPLISVDDLRRGLEAVRCHRCGCWGTTDGKGGCVACGDPHPAGFHEQLEALEQNARHEK